MTTTVLAHFEAQPELHDKLRTELEALIEPTTDEPGCMEYQLYADPNRPGQLLMVEQWTDVASLERHLAAPHVQRFLTVTHTLLAQPPTIRRFTESQ